MADALDYTMDPEVEKAREASLAAAGNVQTMTSAVNLLPYKLRDAINEKLDYNKDLITQKNKAMEDYFAAPAEARVKYEDIWNPNQREALVSRATAQAYTPYANLSDILSTRQGGIADLIGAAGTNARADLTATTDSAQLLRQRYEDLLGELKDKRDYNLDVYKATKEDSGGGLTLADLLGATGTDTQDNGGGSYEEPPYPSVRNASQQLEYPSGSGIVWHSDGNGGWE